MMAKNLIRLAAYTADDRYDEAARRTLALLTEAMRQYPQAFGESLSAIDMLVDGLSEVAIVGSLDNPTSKSLLDVVRKPYRPNLITALSPMDVPAEATIPLLGYRTLRHNQPTVYVCRHFACANPVNTPAEVETLLSFKQS